MLSFLRRCGVIASFVLVAIPATAATITLTSSSADATIYQNNPNNSNGAGPALFAGTNGAGSPRRGLLKFDVAGSIPVGATIDSVELTLFLAQVAGSGGGGAGDATPRAIELHPLSADWGEGVTGLGAMVGGSGQGFAGNTGDATWNERMCGSTPCGTVLGSPWTTAGGDFGATSASTLVGNTVNSPYSWLSTPALVSDAQSWLDNPATNFGWAVINADELTATDFRAFFTRENGDAAFNPQLTIDYTLAVQAVPEPASLTLLGLGLVGLARGCWKQRQAS